MNKEEFKNIIINKLSYYGFRLDNIDGKYKVRIKINTPDELVIVNGAPRHLPGKTGEIDLIAIISDDIGEVDNNNNIINEMIGVYMQTEFHGVEFQGTHSIIPIGDKEMVDNTILSFLHIFNMV